MLPLSAVVHIRVAAALQVYFGQKDAMQCVVIRKMIADLHVPLEMHVVPTKREPDGLAMSSRHSSALHGRSCSQSVAFRRWTTGPHEIRFVPTSDCYVCACVCLCQK
jgi:pantothenate synthetase